MRATTFAGNYPIEHRRGEIERLHIQAEAVARRDLFTQHD